LHGKIRKGQEALTGGAEPVFTGTSKAIISQLVTEYMENGKSRQTVVDSINRAGGGTMTAAQRDVEYQGVQATDRAKIDRSVEEFKSKIAELLPRFAELLPTILELSSSFANLAVKIGNNPIAGIGLLMGASITAEIGKAAIGTAFQKGIQGLLSLRGGLSGGGIGGSSGGNWQMNGSTLATGAAIALTAATVYLTGKSIIDSAFGGAEETGKAAHAKETEAENLLREMKNSRENGGVTKEQLARARALSVETSNMAPKLNDEMNSFFTGDTAKGNAAGTTPESLRQTSAALTEFIGAVQKASQEMSNMKGGDVSNPNDPARGVMQ
jgi:hypothetical protein